MKTKKLSLFMLIIGVVSIVLIIGYRLTTEPVQPLPKTTLTPSGAEAPPSSRAPVTSTLTTPAVNSDTPAPDSLNTPAVNFRPGSLLTNENRNRIYYITAEGTARRIEGWMTTYALGFQREAALTVNEATLDQIPLSDPLTQHFYDDNDYHYWAVDGALWAIDAWQATLTAPAYRGIPPTPADSLLLAGMPVVNAIPDDILMRDGVKFYVKQGGFVYPVVSSSVFQAFGYKFNRAIEVPHGVMAQHDSKSPLTRFLQDRDKIYEIVDGQRRPITLAKLIDSGYNKGDVRTVPAGFLRTLPLIDTSVSLRASSPVVNLRQGPGTGYPVVDQVSASEKLMAIARTQNNSWFKVRYQGKTAWVAASVVDPTGDLESLPKIDATIVYAAPTPTSEPTSAPLKPLLCNKVPIRGFGKVWAEHVEVQHGLQCPSHDEKGTQATVQQFQHGFMIWVTQDSSRGGEPVYVFVDDSTYQRFDNPRPADPAAVKSTPC